MSIRSWIPERYRFGRTNRPVSALVDGNITEPKPAARDLDAAPADVFATADLVVLIDGNALLAASTQDRSTGQHVQLVQALEEFQEANRSSALDVIFSGASTWSDDLPTSKALRLRVAAQGIEPAHAMSELCSGYPPEWPMVIVADRRSFAPAASAAWWMSPADFAERLT